VLAYYPLSYWSLLGMETGLLSLLSLGALLLTMRLGSEPRGMKLLGLLFGLMFATRPDAAFPAALMLAFRAVWILRRERRLRALKPWLVELAPFVTVAFGLTLFRLAYYGDALPNSYALKVEGWPLVPRLENGWKFVLRFLEESRYLVLLSLASVLLRRDGRRLLLFSFASTVVACQIWVGGDAWPYWRLLVPAVAVFAVLSVDGAGALIRLVMRRERPALTLGFALASATVALLAANERFMDEIRMDLPAYKVPLNRRTVKDGLELSRYAEREASVAVMAAGALPYYSGLRGVDVLGKSDRHIARLRPAPELCVGTVTPGHNKYDLYYSLGKLRPDVIYDALTWARYQPGIFEFVKANYTQRGKYWFRNDSRYVRWERLPR
jgi:hypothetical protein